MGLRKGNKNSVLPTFLGGWWLPFALVIASGVIVLGDDIAREWLRFERARVSDGQLWRLITGHFAHLGAQHFLLNAAGLCLTWHLVGRSLATVQWLAVLGCSIIAIDLGFWLLEPGLTWYVGLSGMLHGVLVAGIIAGWQQDRTTSLFLALLVTGKLAYEQWFGPLPGSEASSGGAVVVAAHLYGAIGGMIGSAAIVLWRRDSVQSG